MAKIGPVGRKKEGEEWDHKGRSKVVQIFASFGSRFLNSLWFQYLQDDGVLATSEIIGRQTFTTPTFQTIVLDYPSEYITEVNGFCSSYIEEVTIVTNVSKYELKPYKGGDIHGLYEKQIKDEGKWFKLDMGRLNQFGGFHGTHDDKGVRSIGLYIEPSNTLPPDRPMFHNLGPIYSQLQAMQARGPPHHGRGRGPKASFC